MKRLKKWGKKRYLSILLTLLILVGGVFFTLHTRRGREEGEAYRVHVTDIRDEIRLAGVVDDEHRVDLGFARGGRVANVYVREGQEVKKGTVLAELDQSREYAQTQSAKMDYLITKINTDASSREVDIDYEKLLEEQKLRVETLRNEFLSSDLEARLVTTDDPKVRSPLPAPVISGVYRGGKEGVYHLRVYRSKDTLGYTFELTGLEGRSYYPVEVYTPGKLGENGLFIQFPQGDLHRYRDTEWEVRIPNVHSPHYLERKHAYEEALKKYDELKAKLSLSKEKLHDATFAGIPYTKANVERSRSQYRTLLASLEDGKIRAPFDGIVARNDLEPGKIVGAFRPVIHFISGKKKVVLDVPEVYVNRIQVGEKADITLDAYPETHYEGEVEKIDEVEKGGEGSALYGADLTILNQDERVRIGMSATATFSKLLREHVLAIPYHLVHTGGGKNVVFLRSGEGTVEEREVELGVVGNNGLIEVRSGLREGDVVVARAKSRAL